MDNTVREERLGGARLGIAKRLFAPIDVASIVVFRVAFGLIALWEVGRYFDNRWIKSFYIDPKFYFAYPGFEWVQPWPGDGMHYHFLALAIVAALITVGLFYRIATVLFWLGFTYVFLLDQTRYLNHFYLVSLMSFLMIFMPAHRARSLDCVRRPSLRSDTVPAWTLLLLRLQLGLVYFYGGVAKINGDWLRGEPMRDWLASRSDFPLVGAFFTQEWCVYGFTYGGLFFDLLVFPGLLWSRSRPFFVVVCLMFHLTNVFLFNIGIFPWFMIAATTLFFRPDWPRRACFMFSPVATAPPDPTVDDHVPAPVAFCPSRLVVALLAIYVAIQVVVPLRHFVYPGLVHWNEAGHLFSWHMKLRDKSGAVKVKAFSPSERKTFQVRLSRYLTKKQVRKMSGRPEMLLQFAHHLAAEYRSRGYADIEIYVDARVSLNGRERQHLVDPERDLAQVTSSQWRDWVLPLTEPLRSPKP